MQLLSTKYLLLPLAGLPSFSGVLATLLAYSLAFWQSQEILHYSTQGEYPVAGRAPELLADKCRILCKSLVGDVGIYIESSFHCKLVHTQAFDVVN